MKMIRDHVTNKVCSFNKTKDKSGPLVLDRNRTECVNKTELPACHKTTVALNCATASTQDALNMINVGTQILVDRG